MTEAYIKKAIREKKVDEEDHEEFKLTEEEIAKAEAEAPETPDDMMVDLSDDDNEMLATDIDEDNEAKNDEHEEENKEAEEVGDRLETEEEDTHDQEEHANDIRNTIGEKF